MRTSKNLFLGLILTGACVASSAAWGGRRLTDLSGAGWLADGVAVSVPHCWNGVDGADGPNGHEPIRHETSACAESYERKAVRYERALPDPTSGRRVFLRFEGASQVATVFVNGTTVGHHVGAFTGFTCEITSALRATDNKLLVEVSNAYSADIPPVGADFTLFGGLYRAVWLLETDSVCIDPVTDGADGVTLDIDVARGHVTAQVRVLGGTNEVQHFDFPNRRLWSPEDPAVYEVTVKVSQKGCEDAVTLPFGFRTMEFRADGGFYLNGVRRQLRGVNRHQDREGRGWVVTAAEEDADLSLIREMGADALRTAHYPQSHHIYDLCDRKGLITWLEHPMVDFITFTDRFRANVRTMVREMIAQNRHHPSVFGWSLSNELYNPWEIKKGVPIADYAAFMREINAYAKALDPTRPTLQALCRLFTDMRPVYEVTDAVGFNTYPGWYDRRTADVVFTNIFDVVARPTLALSEYGVGASIHHHGPFRAYVAPGGGYHPEERQAYQLSEDLKEITGNPRFWGSFVWAMFDFGADARTEGDRHGINDKGLVCYDHTTRKDAFYLYQANWTARPVLHLVGTRATSTTNGVIDVMAFSNLGPVALAVNGAQVGVRTPDEVKRVIFDGVRLRPGANELTVTSGAESRTWKLAVTSDSN